MMRSWHVRLEGGPFDGDHADVTWLAPVPCLWVEPCDECHETHWYGSWTHDGEPYNLDETDLVARRARYVHADLAPAGGPIYREEIHA
jgi:hypothetical protein